ncbi:hypothetical protein B0O99DRAFT_592853 [Bisporella sp. PMI_857]|nr:hypothetical protein B0O99DRAFT_592853 [Bisporella sp. PMI_857]
MSDDRFIFRDLYAEYHIRPDGTSWFSVPDYSVLPERALTAVTQRAEQMCSILKTYNYMRDQVSFGLVPAIDFKLRCYTMQVEEMRAWANAQIYHIQCFGLEPGTPPPTTLVMAAVPNPDSFLPSSMIQTRRGIPHSLSEVPRPPRTAGKRMEADNYHGSKTSRAWQQQIAGLSDGQNCALWITGIPEFVTEADIFAVINTGAVYCVHLMVPNQQHPTKAAKLIFTTLPGCQIFMAQYQQFGLRLGGMSVQIRFNRHGQLPYHGSHTRVILIEGPDEVMTIPAWASYLQRFSIFQLEHARKVECFKLGRTMIELRFARIDGQAEACFLALERNAVIHPHITVQYGPDPCDPLSPRLTEVVESFY